MRYLPFSDPELWKLVRGCSWSKLPPRTVVIKEGDQVEAMYLLVRGNADVSRQGRPLHTLAAGDWFGEMACFRIENSPNHR